MQFTHEATLGKAGLALALFTLSGFAALPAQAQVALPVSGDYSGGQTGFKQITPTTEEDMIALTSTNASYGLDRVTADYFLTDTNPGAYLTPGTNSIFNIQTLDGASSVFGTFESSNDTVVGMTQQSISVLKITGGTGVFQGASGTITATGTTNSDGSSETVHADGTIFAPVPEASSVVSLGLLLLLGLGGIAVSRRRKVDVLH